FASGWIPPGPSPEPIGSLACPPPISSIGEGTSWSARWGSAIGWIGSVRQRWRGSCHEPAAAAWSRKAPAGSRCRVPATKGGAGHETFACVHDGSGGRILRVGSARKRPGQAYAGLSQRCYVTDGYICSPRAGLLCRGRLERATDGY